MNKDLDILEAFGNIETLLSTLINQNKFYSNNKFIIKNLCDLRRSIEKITNDVDLHKSEETIEESAESDESVALKILLNHINISPNGYILSENGVTQKTGFKIRSKDCVGSTIDIYLTQDEIDKCNLIEVEE